MELYLLRHGVAGQHGDPRYPNDADRPLTKKGRNKLRAQLTGLEAFNVRPNVVITSPLARAQQTAEVVVEGLGLTDRLVVDNRLAPGATTSGVIEILANYQDRAQVMLVGHEPDFSQVAAELSGGNGEIWLRKGGLIRVDLDSIAGRHGVLRWLLEPRHLMLGKKGLAEEEDP